ncbi:hypothetical protein FACS1894167_00770 [Synergistales bacterium]|nr:hypothetical protein FACS1894167_00770 [Synergistales bacterium]GHV52998.1 hypothetical protein FACS1894216_10170 [Synergistales bacterium]
MTRDDGLRHPERFDYDNLWKTVLHRYFWDALKIFLPDLYEASDRSQAPEFLEQELQKVTFDLPGGANRTDLLMGITLKNGDHSLILCHIEVQGEGGSDDIPTRMNRYREAIHLRYDQEPVGIAVITDSRPKSEKTFYRSEQFGIEAVYKYMNVVTANLEDDLLLSDSSRIGLVLYAAKYKQLSGDDDGKKFRYLRDISNLWIERGWDSEDKRIILLAAEYLLSLDDKNYAKQMVTHLESLVKSKNEEERIMYASIFERVYTEQGMEKGMEKGRLEGQTEVARNMLNKGFSIDNVLECTALHREEVERLLK